MDTLTKRFEREVFEPYVELLKASYRFHPTFSHARSEWEAKLGTAELLNGPYLERAQGYKSGDPLDLLPMDERTKVTVRKRLNGRALYSHQTSALRIVLGGENAVIATGTSSGKTLCYQIPILDNILKDPALGLRAIIIYPLNALVNDQLKEWGDLLQDHPEVTFARFTGQTPESQVQYEQRLRESIREQFRERNISGREVELLVQKELNDAPMNRLNHRDEIRSNPPHILITNFSMLEYLLERPIDAPIFENAQLRFLVMDEVHSYRGIQATEIAFLIRRLKDFLAVSKLICIATSATLGKRGDAVSMERVKTFVTSLFGENFQFPIYGDPAEPTIALPSHSPSPADYLRAVEELITSPPHKWGSIFGLADPDRSLISILEADENLFRLRKDILTKPISLADAAVQLWPEATTAEDALQALLRLAANEKSDDAHEDLLPTRLHYFIKSQGGLYVCLNSTCPGRKAGQPAFYVSRKTEDGVPEGYCPSCHHSSMSSLLVEVVSCRKCGYLFGALQDLGPKRKQDPDRGDTPPPPEFDSFSTELGWAADSFWSYFSVAADLPYPNEVAIDEEDDAEGLMNDPAIVRWCASCGKIDDATKKDHCECAIPRIREIKVFHRQCPTDQYQNLFNAEKHLLSACPNCGAPNASGLEPLRRFQESDDETGLAMAIPFAHFEVSNGTARNSSRSLLCFTDHRQRAAAFPSLIEEEVFSHVLGRKLLQIIRNSRSICNLVTLGERISDSADPESSDYDPELFLPVSRQPDETQSSSQRKNLWVAETFAYFGIPDSARESIEDLGLVEVTYQIDEIDRRVLAATLESCGVLQDEVDPFLQVLFAHMRHRKAFTLPADRVKADDPAFGRVTADIFFLERRGGIRNCEGWLPKLKQDGTYNHNYITDFLKRVTKASDEQVLQVSESLWSILTSRMILARKNNQWRLEHERIRVALSADRLVCDRCGIVTPFNVRQRCVRKHCQGSLKREAYTASRENLISKWVSDSLPYKFAGLKSEEHTAQINRELAERIEKDFRSGEVDVLSSTTTFEMGINIGDLQKVLLRNAPPTSASYVQRVGRAGRGRDKNAVCVTLCRRTKYDADSWSNPGRLMSGEVRTPTVFLKNAVIAERHSNAVLFSMFLREKIRDERLLGDPTQKIRLEAFLHPHDRTQVPPNWMRLNPSTLHLDFVGWLDNEKLDPNSQVKVNSDLLTALGGHETALNMASSRYRKVIESVSTELREFMQERQRLVGEGENISDLDQAIKTLLGSSAIDVLAKRGFLPRYAFPLDTVTLETGRTRWTRDPDVELSRDCGIAIAEFAPGAQVIAHKKVFTSAGLYIVTDLDRSSAQYKWYSVCPSCKQVRSGNMRVALTGDCPVCHKKITSQNVFPYIEPVAFSTRIEQRGSSSARHRRSSFIRQRQTLTHFISQISDERFANDGMFDLALEEQGELFRYNRGPGGGGFIQCLECGYSELASTSRARVPHRRLRSFGRTGNCIGRPKALPVAYGHKFTSFCLVARPVVRPESIQSLAFALQGGVAKVLEVEAADIGVSWRWLADRNAGDTQSEVVLFDQAPGGAGFMIDAREHWSEVIREAYGICDGRCGCRSACYDCLKHYGNQAWHDLLDRESVVRFLRPAFV